MHPDPITLHVLWRETSSRLASLHRAVDAGQRLQEAVDFASYVQFSGLPKLLKQYAPDKDFPWDGHLLTHQAEELRMAACTRLRSGDTTAHLQASDLETLSRKLDLIAGAVGRLIPPAS